MREILLRAESAEGLPLEALFLPDGGMNLARFRWGEFDLIDRSTLPLYQERFAGLGALIGPHFHHRRVISSVPHEERFPHIARLRAKGVEEPFSHGIARYAPWQVKEEGGRVEGLLQGKEEWEGVPLSVLEGQNFTMRFAAELSSKGLRLDASVVSDTDSLVGFHYYWRLPSGENHVRSRVAPQCIIEGNRQPIPSALGYTDHQLDYRVGPSVDATFHPLPDPLTAEIVLETKEYHLRIRYASPSQENAWQLYHPEGASYVCIEPVSAQDPRHPNLTVSRITVMIDCLPIQREGG